MHKKSRKCKRRRYTFEPKFHIPEIKNTLKDLFEKDIYEQAEIKNLNLVQIKEKMVPVPSKKYMSDEEIINRIKRKQPRLVDLLRDGEKLSYNTPLIRKYQKQGDFYDLPYKFAIAANNQRNLTGNAYIKDYTPSLFEGIDEKELYGALDILSTNLRMYNFDKSKMLIGQYKNFEIAGRKFRATLIGNGLEGFVYKIEQEGNNENVVMKIFSNPDFIGSSDSFGSMAIHREASKAGCSDVPKFMMANPLPQTYQLNGAKEYLGGWQIVENVSEKNSADNSKPVVNWLDKHNLHHYDLKDDVRTNGFMTDFGYITTPDIKDMDSNTLYSSNNRAVNDFFKEYSLGKTTKDLYEQLI